MNPRRLSLIGLVLIVCATILTCSSPEDLFSTVRGLDAIADYGGAFVKTYGGNGSDNLADIAEIDGDYYMVGSTDSFGVSRPSALIVGIRKEGFVLHPLVITPSGADDQIIPVACGIQEDTDDNYLVVAAELYDSAAAVGQQYDLLVFRIALSNHALDWAVRISEPGSDEQPTDIVADQKDYLITGYTNRTGDDRPFAIVVSYDETVGSAYVYSASAGPTPVAFYSSVREDGGYICVGEATDGSGDATGLVARLSYGLSVNAMFAAETDATIGIDHRLGGVIATSSGAYVFAGQVDGMPAWSPHQTGLWFWTTDEALDTIATFGIWVGDELAPTRPAAALAASSDPALSNRFVFFAESLAGALVDTSGNVDWAVQASAHEIAAGTLDAIISLDDGGFIAAGTNPTRPASEYATPDSDPEGIALWCPPFDGSSYPATEPTHSDVRQAGPDVVTTTISATTTVWDAGASQQDYSVTIDNEVNITRVPYLD